MRQFWILDCRFWIAGFGLNFTPESDETFANGGMLAERCFNFTELDPTSANLDLAIQSAETLDIAVGAIAR